MTDRTTEFDPEQLKVADQTDDQATVNLANQSDTNPQPFHPPAPQATLSLPATPSAMIDLNQLETGAETITYPRTFGPYELIEEIARGGMGVVFKAKQRGLDRIVALKMILGMQNQGTNAQRFIEEARAIGALDHPNVVPIFDIGEISGRMYFTMPFVNGPSLKALVEKTGVPTIQKTLTLFLQIASGVAQAHRAGIVHRDLKPANVLVDSDGRPRVADFGLAKRSGDSDRMNMTGTGQLMGTPAYMSPEQARDSKDVTAATDVYALGAILYYLLTGRGPFVSDSIPDLLIKIVSEMPLPPHEVNRAIPEDVSQFCMKCLAKSPIDRYPDAVALSESLAILAERYLSRSAVHAQYHSDLADSLSLTNTGTIPFAISGLPGDPPRRSPRPWLGLAAALALVLGGTAAAVYFWPRKDAVQPIANANTGTDPLLQPAPGTAPPQTGGTPVAANTNTGATPLPVAEDKTWPEPQADFGLGLELQGRVRKVPVVNGVAQLTDKSLLELQLRPAVDCWVYVFVVAPDESAVLLYPNEHERNNFLPGGVLKVIPSDPKYGLQAETTEGPGVERVRVMAATTLLPGLPPGKVVGNFQQFATTVHKSELGKAVRSLRSIKQVELPGVATGNGKVQFAEAEVQFRVK